MAGFLFIHASEKTANLFSTCNLNLSNRTYTTAESTYCTSYRAAPQWYENYLLKNDVPIPIQNITFGEYSKEFFSWTGHWATNKKVEGR